MTSDFLMAFSTIFILELLLGTDSLILINLLIKSANYKRLGVRIAANLGVITSKIIILSICYWLVYKSQIEFMILGIEVGLKNIFLFSGGVFILIKAALELLEMYHTTTKLLTHPPINLANVNLQKLFLQVVFISALISFDAALIAISYSDNFLSMAAAILGASVIIGFYPAKIFKFLYRNYRLRVLALLFSLLLGLKMIVGSVGIEIENILLFYILFFTLVYEIINKLINHNNYKNKSHFSRK